MAQGAYVLHRRPYLDDAALAELLLEDDSRAGAVVRGMAAKKSHKRAAMQPFVLLELTLAGQGDLKNARSIEVKSPHSLAGNALYAGFYVNELILRLVPRGADTDGLFRLYQQTLLALATGEVEPVLRRFELSLCHRLGYGVDLWRDTQGQPLNPQGRYQLVAEEGLLADVKGPYPGQALLAMAQDHWQDEGTRRTAKLFCRALLAPMLGDKPLKSRELFRLAGGVQ
ncbi:DNA repair protein RecO [Gallaecimonas xiamenensis]|uniref:DNA repair protein RecO n=1 Tax=Gallaecimonas xiamenensis 3-C-1 TaxID=745411 RepID=K2ID57_9GAMM|nr:DNA repair protein RecO [Gallaecimonas xiamenensis]EKE67911.1 DNA repair protein RecO [Gallaecimonas xiamenensis 3-C-1]